MADKFLQNVSDIVESLEEYDKRGQTAFQAMALQAHSIQRYVREFVAKDKRDINGEELDLISIIIVAAKTVYESDKYVDPFTDEVYDKMLTKFKKFRAEPFGGNSVGLANAHYKYDTLSGTLDKVHFIREKDRGENEDRGSLENYIMSIPVGKKDEFSMLVNQKKDGTSVTIDYKLYPDGYYYPQSAISRGKKDYGEGTDVSAVMPNSHFESKYLKALLGFAPQYVGVQYEMLISDEKKKEFESFLGQEFSNNRSAVSGLLRRIIFSKGGKELSTLKSFVSLVPVGFDVLPQYVVDDSYYDIPWDKIYIIICKSFMHGDINMQYELITGTKKDILKRFEDIADEQLSHRSTLNHAIDGLVLTVTSRRLQSKMGRRNNINQYQIAYKFPEQAVKTKVRDYIITTGNFGYKEILLIVDPVNLNGTTQFKAQMHSVDRLNKMDIRIGDEIILKLSGDVIPYGYKDDSCEPGDGPRVELPKYCECGAPLVIENNRLRCSDRNCPYRITGALVNFFTALNAKGIGPKACEQLNKELGITKPSQVLQLTQKDFESLSGFGKDSAKACINTINDILTRPRSVASIMSSLGIDSLRASTASKLLDAVSLDTLLVCIASGDRNKLVELIKRSDGINLNASKIADGLINNFDEFKKLLTLMTIKEDKNESNNLTKTLVVSGLRNDEELELLANKAGFRVKDSGSKYDLLVVKNESMLDHSKAQYARSHGIPILTRKEFMNKYNK